MVTRVEILEPPAALLVDTPIPAWTGGAYRDLVEYSLELISALHRANADKAALREWVSQANSDNTQ